MFKRVLFFGCVAGALLVYTSHDARSAPGVARLVNSVTEWLTSVSAWVRKQQVEDRLDQIVDEEVRLNEDLEVVRQAFLSMEGVDPRVVAEMRQIAFELLATRKSLVNQRGEQLAELCRECIRDLDRLMLIEKSRSADKMWELARRKLAYVKRIATKDDRRGDDEPQTPQDRHRDASGDETRGESSSSRDELEPRGLFAEPPQSSSDNAAVPAAEPFDRSSSRIDRDVVDDFRVAIAAGIRDSVDALRAEWHKQSEPPSAEQATQEQIAALLAKIDQLQAELAACQARLDKGTNVVASYGATRRCRLFGR